MLKLLLKFFFGRPQGFQHPPTPKVVSEPSKAHQDSSEDFKFTPQSWKDEMPAGWENLKLRDLIFECLRLHPDRRYTALEVHEWISGELGLGFALTATQGELSRLQFERKMLTGEKLSAPAHKRPVWHYQLAAWQDPCVSST